MTHDDIKKLLEGITQGEWEPDTGLEMSRAYAIGPATHYSLSSDQIKAQQQADKDSEFIAAAPSIVRQLLKENEELQRCYEVTNKSWTNMATENQRLTQALEKIASDNSWDVGRQTIAIKTLRGD